MTAWVVIVVVAVFLFIAVDTIKSYVVRRSPTLQSRVINPDTERIVKIEAEVEAKMNEIHRHQSERKLRQVPVPGAAAAAPAAPASKGRDPMNDTKCIAAVKEKVEEIERLGREKGISKS